jgi:predicted acetyltransferase
MAKSEEVVLDPIPKDQASVLGNLFELYAHDFSEHAPLQLKPNGRFDIAPADTWWTEGHFPFFIRWKRQLAGFALVRKGSRVTGATDVMDVAEFFVTRGCRKNKLGAIVAHAIFKAFPGPWDIRVRQTNAAAKLFWAHVAATWVGRAVPSVPFSTEGVDWHVFHLPKVT